VKNYFKYISAVCLLLIAASAFAAGNAQLIQRYSKIYEDNINKYETEFFKQKQRCCIDYIKVLKTKRDKLQTSGDLDGWEALNKELARFRDKPVVNEIVSSPADLRKIQDAYCKHLGQLEHKKNSQMVDFKKKYITKLEGLQKKWTKEGKFEDAYLAKAEIKKINESEKLTKAEKALAKHNGSLSKPTGTAKLSSVKGRKSATKPPKENMVLKDGTIIYPPGISPRQRGMSHKPVTLSRSKLSPWPSSISVKINVSTDKSDNTRRSGYVTYGSSSDTRKARVSMRTNASGDIKKKLRLLIQYYTKAASGSSSPKLLTTKNILIPYLDKRFVSVDVAPVSISSSSTTYHSYGSRRHSGLTGERVYGYVLSVLNADGNLLYQGITKSTLNSIVKVPDIKEGNLEALKADYDAAQTAYNNANMAYYKDTCNAELIQNRDKARSEYNKARSKYYSVLNGH